METTDQINAYIESLPEDRRNEMLHLHRIFCEWMPDVELWFLDGKNAEGRTISNPNIGYGSNTMHYANGKSREFYRIGLSANSTGISVYIMGIEDKKYLASSIGDRIGKASVTGYCIKFKTMGHIDLDVLKEAVLDIVP